MKSPLLPLAACFGFGILLARPQHLAIPEALLRIPALLAAGAACLLAGLISLRIHSGGRRQSPSNPTNSRPIAGEGGTVTDGNVSRATPLQQGKWLTVCEVCALAGFVFGGSAAGRLFEIRFPPNHISHLESLGIRPGELALIEGHLVSVPRRSSSGLQFELETVNIAPAPLSVAGQIGGPAVRSH